MKYNKILIVTEAYTFGGLETHLYGKIKNLYRLGYKVFLVTGNSFLEENLPVEFCERIFTSFNFSSDSTVHNLIQVTNQLVSIIREEDIEIIDAHPFFSAFPAFFSAALTKTPFIYTMHGPASIMEGFGQLMEWFVKCLLLPNASLVSTVSEETYFLAKQHASDGKIKVFRNAVDNQLFQSSANGQIVDWKCCLVCRLDSAKVVGVKQFLLLAATSRITEIDIYGDGPERGHLASWIADNLHNSIVSVNLKGLSLSLQKVYKEYSIVAGMGRVALEAASMNKPVILVGYDGVKGLLDHNLMEKAAYANLSGRGLQNISNIVFEQQLKNLSEDEQPYLLAEWVESNATESHTWNAFSDQVQLLSPVFSDLVLDIYQCFESYESDLSYTSDVELFKRIRAVLTSARYIDSAAYKIWRLYDLQASENSWVYRLHNAELVIISHVDQVVADFKKEVIEQSRISHAEKDQKISDSNALVQQLHELLLKNERQLHAKVEEVAQREAKIKELITSLSSTQEKLIEKEQELKEKGGELKNLRSELEFNIQKIDKIELQLNEQTKLNAQLVKDLELALHSSSTKEKYISEQEELIKGFYAQILENEHKTKERELFISNLKHEVNSLKVDNEWYKATFLNRSILGVLKEKMLGPALKK